MVGGEERGKSKFHTRVILLNLLLLHWLWLTPSEIISNSQANCASSLQFTRNFLIVEIKRYWNVGWCTFTGDKKYQSEAADSDHSVGDVVWHWERSQDWLDRLVVLTGGTRPSLPPSLCCPGYSGGQPYWNSWPANKTFGKHSPLLT